MAKIPKTKLGNQTAISEKLDFSASTPNILSKIHKEMPMHSIVRFIPIPPYASSKKQKQLL
jgi:hypothetical protein